MRYETMTLGGNVIRFPVELRGEALDRSPDRGRPGFA